MDRNQNQNQPLHGPQHAAHPPAGEVNHNQANAAQVQHAPQPNVDHANVHPTPNQTQPPPATPGVIGAQGRTAAPAATAGPVGTPTFPVMPAMPAMALGAHPSPFQIPPMQIPVPMPPHQMPTPSVPPPSMLFGGMPPPLSPLMHFGSGGVPPGFVPFNFRSAVNTPIDRLSATQLVELEGEERDKILKRIEFLREFRAELDAMLARFGQYETVASNSNSETPRRERSGSRD